MTGQFRGKIYLLSVLLALCCFFLPGCAQNQGLTPRAQDGFIELADYGNQAVNLQGEWEFYWQQLLEPQDFTEDGPKPGYIDVPGCWNGYQWESQTLSGKGFATYRLVINSSFPGTKAVLIPTISTAYKLWIDGKLVAACGQVGQGPGAPQYLSSIVSFQPQNEDIEVVIQVSNYMHRKGGIWGNIYFGPIQEILKVRENRLGGEMFLIGSLLVMGIYCLMLFLLRRQEKSTLFFGLLCILICLRLFLVGELCITTWFPDFNWETGFKIKLLTYYLALPLLALFMRSIFPQEISERVVSWLVMAGIAFSLLIIVLKAPVYMNFHIIYQVITMAGIIYMMYGLIRAVGNHRDGALVIAIGGLAFLVTIINDILYFNEIILTGNLAPLGFFIFMLAQALIISVNFSRAFNRAETLAVENTAMVKDIKGLNKNLEERIAARTAELNKIIEQLNKEIAERKQVESQLRTYARTDLMTGTLNRFAGMRFLKQQMDLANEHDGYLTVCFLDVDNLKAINDKHGHQIGDELIVTFSRIVKENVRQSDTVCRLGGDEFLIIFPCCRLQQAELVWERICDKVEVFNHKQANDYQISVSYGFAERAPGDKTTINELIGQADREMYKKKRA